MREILVGKNDSGQRVDKFLLKFMPTLPTALLYKYLRKKCIRVNSKHCTDPAVILKSGDVLNLYISDEFFDNNEKQTAEYKEGSLDIVFEDANIILLNKPSGLSVHPDEKQTEDTLIDRLCSYLAFKGEYDSKNEQSFTPSLCNRLDRNTCGIVIGAKNAQALREMNEIIKNREIVKKYRCIVHGSPSKDRATLKNYLYKNSDDKIVTVYDTPVSDGKTAVLEYTRICNKTLADGSLASMLEVILHTGRTHQIRAQLAHIGHSIVGDGKYGKSYASDKKNGYKYQALCSFYLKFDFSSQHSTLYYLNGLEFSINADLWR